MNRNRLKKYGVSLLLYVVLALAFYLIGGEQLRSISVEDSYTEFKGVLPEFSAGQMIEQTFTSNMETLDSIQIMVATYARKNTGLVKMRLEDDTKQGVLAETSVDVAALEDNTTYTWMLETPLEGVKGKELILVLESHCNPGGEITLYYGDVADNRYQLRVNGNDFVGQLHMSIKGRNYSFFGMYYWRWVAILGFIIACYSMWSDYQESKGRLTKGKLIFVVWERYKFLIQQLVARDFKTKYKRSVLGYLWSFLNPLLTMLVQYIVFSTLFKNGIDNYPVYLLTGIILFNFFSEAVGQGLGSIVYNAPLITKVYVPKYIYPVTKVISTSINLFISIIPLLLVTLLTGVKITPAILLLPFVLICLLLFCIGMVLMLSSAMVFFRDTQYLWGIISMIWMYATPLFYPESIIPLRFRFIQTLNPMYYMIKFARIIFIDGLSPTPMLYGACLLSAVMTCFLGATIFKKTQNKFVLYI